MSELEQSLVALIRQVPEASRERLRILLSRTEVPPGRVARDLGVARIDDLVFAKNAVLSRSDIDWPNSIRYGFVEVADAIVTPWGFLIHGDQLVFNTQILPGGWMRGADGGAPELAQRIFDRNFIHQLDIWRETCRLSLPETLEEVDEAFLFNSRLTCFNFAHFVHDTLIQAPTYSDACAHAGRALAPMLVGPRFPYPAMPEIFRAAIGPTPPLFIRNRFLRVRRLFVPLTHFRPSNEAIARGAVQRLMRTLEAGLRPYSAPGKRRVFVSREDSSRGSDREPRFANTDELRAALARLGVEVLVVSRLGVEEYLRAFVNAELIVGLHGAGITNVVLSPTPRVCEITVPGYPDWHSLRLFIETGMGAAFRRVVMPPPRDGVALYDVPAIVSACEALLATSCPAWDPRL